MMMNDVPDMNNDDKHQDVSDPHYSKEPVPGPSQVLIDISNENHQKLDPLAEMEPIVTPKPGSSQLFIDSTNEHQNLVSPVISMSIQKPKDTSLYKKCMKHMKEICDLRNRLKKIKRKEILNVLSENESVQYLMKKLNPSVALMLQSQLRNVKRKYMGRRWTLKEKIKALRLYKRSATCYRLLQRLWCLPAQNTLKSLLSQFPLNTGINDKIFNGLKKYVRTQISSDNEYILMFDALAVKKQLWYNSKQDKIVGYQDHGSQGTTQEEATYALVFMVAGITTNIKLPIAFYLLGANTTSDRLAVLIKEVLIKCFRIRMSITATVCVMNRVNREALLILGASKDQPYFNIKNKKVVSIFDPPHLLKCFRNLFLKYNLKCTNIITSGNTNGEGIAKWSHIQEFYNLDNNNAHFVFAPILSNDLVNPNKKQIKKVIPAAQVLNHSVAVGMFAKVSQGELTADANTTAEVIMKVDKLFNCLNSDPPERPSGIPHSANMSTKSPHLKHFEAMITFFEKLEFVGCPSSPPLKDGWVWTLNGITKIFNNLKQKHLRQIQSLETRRLQLYQLEYLFYTIRANCANSKPTTSQFIDELKTAIISNLAYIRSGNICEEDNKFVTRDWNR